MTRRRSCATRPIRAVRIHRCHVSRATVAHPSIEYSLEVAAIFPAVPGVAANDPSFDGFRRDFLDIFQLQAELYVLANNAASDPCAFTVYEYADMARYTPELCKGLPPSTWCGRRWIATWRVFSYGMPGYRIFED